MSAAPDTAGGFDAALIEAMARAMAERDGQDMDDWSPLYEHRATAALTALCAARPDVAALLAASPHAKEPKA